MQRKASKSTRSTNAAERRYIAWVKQQDCVTCGSPAPNIADHIYGSAHKLKWNYETLLTGPWLIIPLCQRCDSVKTCGSHRAFENHFGARQVDYWFDFIQGYESVPSEIYWAVRGRMAA